MHQPAQDDVFVRTTREQSPDPDLRRRCANGIHRETLRLEAAYRLQLDASARARAEEAGLLGELIRSLRPALPALASPLLLLDVTAPHRPRLVHLRAFLLFGRTPQPVACANTRHPMEALFLCEDAGFLRVRFTGATAPTEVGRLAFAASQLEAPDVRGVVRDHGVARVAVVLAQGMAAQTARRSAQTRDAQRQLERLRALRVLLER